jgi:hypothetical protein
MARMRVREMFDLGAITRRYEALYTRLVCGASNISQPRESICPSIDMDVPSLSVS